MTAIVLAVSLLLAGPSILAVAQGTGEVDTALLHLVLALVVTSVAGQVVRTVVRAYQEQASRTPAPEVDETVGRRRDDR
ncbi:hypothetical protein [Kineococcus sp. NPDC059986]|jgi:hypothetical protein|uniref:hypothetical protein n=1 Tax=Kineococcus sp. NPDC059986 TaxID=3155538 RepID=UPI00344EC56B